MNSLTGQCRFPALPDDYLSDVDKRKESKR